MLTHMRAGLMAALVLFASFLAPCFSFAADKPYHRDDLADAAIRLEGQLKSEAGVITKPPVALRQEAVQAATRNDPRALLPLLRQIAVAAPKDSANWLRFAKTMMQITAADSSERMTLLDRAATAAYIAYQRAPAGSQGGSQTAPQAGPQAVPPAGSQEADALSVIGQSFALRSLWRPALDALRLSLDLREVADIRAQYDKLRDDHGFRILDYSVDSDSASPRACFQFSEALPGRSTDFLPFVSVARRDKPALSADDKQLCVEGLVHGEHYDITLRAGLPSTVKETLAKTAQYSVYVRDRAPFVHFTTKAYVLPRTGQRGIPVVSVNTPGITVKVYRIGDRNLLETVQGRNFQNALSSSELQQIAETQGVAVWSGELKVESPLNAEVTTAFPADEAIGNLAPGVYVMSAEPAGPKKDDDYSDLATQWFIVSDLGLTAFSGHDGIHVFVNSLSLAAPAAQTEIRLVTRNNEVMATKRTDAGGHVVFEPGLGRGEGGSAPALLVATDSHGDYAFLSLTGAAFDFSDRGVAGRTVPAGLDAFVYTERGVYRTGETVHVTALLRDPAGLAATGAPLTLVVERPDGVEYRRAAVADQGLGGRNLDVAIAATASTGTWRVRAFSDPKRPAIGEASFMVEDYVPDRMEFDLATKVKAAAKGKPFEVTVEGRFLYGAPASDLDITGKVVIQPASGRPGYDGYQFGAAGDDEAKAEQALEDLPQTDKAGKAKFDVLIDKLPETTKPLEAQVTVSMAEAGGRAIERKLTVPVTPPAAMIGVKPLFAAGSLGDNDNATFDVVVVAPDGAAVPRTGLRYALMKIESRYQWYRQDGSWNYEPIKQTKRVADGALDVAAGQPGRISAPVVFGRYRLEVSSPDGGTAATTVAFDVGFYTEASADTPDRLETALDKPEYRPGDNMTVAVTARTAGKVMLNVVTDRVVATVNQNVQPGLNQIRVPVGRDWGNGGYVVATLLRPLDVAAKRMPGRAIGVQWFSVDRTAKTLAIAMDLPQMMRPGQTLRVPVKIDGAAGQEAYLVVAAVDVGILNLTGYKPPSPDDYFLGQRRLTAEVRDLYGQLIDGMQATRGQIRSGGDGSAAELQGSPPTQPPVTLYSGIIAAGRDGTAEVSFDIPEFAGAVRVMAVAWSRDKVGHAVADVTVRDPVVATATLPRFVLNGDRSNLQLELDNVEGPAGAYQVSVEADGPVRLGGAGPQTVQLRPSQRNRLSIPLTAAAAGAADLRLHIAGPENFTLDRTYHLAAKPATQVLTRRTVRTIAPGESVTLSSDQLADLVPGTGSVALSVGPSAALDVATLLKALDRYPFGCTEQITSRAMPLLYVNELSVESHLALDAGVDQRIRDAIERVMARQGSNGSFGLWSAGGDDAWLDSYVADFLTRAKQRGFAVPEAGFKLAIERLRNFVVNAPEPGKDGGRDLAYALYVLASNGAAPVGDLRYIADAKLDDVATPIAKAQIAAALGVMGDRLRAERAYAAALADLAPPPKAEVSRADYGSTLRDAAAVVMLAAEGSAPQPTITAAVQKVEAARGAAVHTSTQENAWMVLAARAIGKQARLSLDVAGEARQSPLYRTIRAAELQAAPFKVTNTGAAPVRAVVSVSGAPTMPEPAADKGFKIERAYYTLDGKPADPAKARQNQRFAVVLKVTEPVPQYGRIIIADYLPAGLEIDNPRLVSSGDAGTLSWIEGAAEPVHSEFRDDHFGAAFDRDSKSPAVFTVAYVVRAVSPGTYVLPQAYVEDMYRPDRYGRTATGTVTVSPAAR
jgi:alpha-2-macroglobulin